MPLTFNEFLAASPYFPIVFVKTAGAQHIMPVVMTGLGGEQSLFAESVGSEAAPKWQWDANAYLPAYVRRYPFCMSAVAEEVKDDDDLLVCVEKSHLVGKPSNLHVRLFDGDQPTERWQLIEQFLQSYQADINLTRQFSERLLALDLFYSLEANMAADENLEPVSVTGMFGINEEKLLQLDDANIGELTRNGYLPRIYAHLQSLQNFQKLLNRLKDKQMKAAMASPKSDADRLN